MPLKSGILFLNYPGAARHTHRASPRLIPLNQTRPLAISP